MESQGYCFRLDAREGYLDRLTALQYQYDSFVVAAHKGNKGENPHYHAVIKTSIKDQAFRKRMKTIFTEGKGNGHMSIKPWDGKIEAVSYLFHEDPTSELLCRHGVSDQYIEEARKINQRVRVLVQESKEKASWKLEDEVFDNLDKNIGHNDISIATQLYLTAFRSGKYPPQPHHCRAMTQKIQFRLCDGDEKLEEKLARSLAENIFRF